MRALCLVGCLDHGLLVHLLLLLLMRVLHCDMLLLLSIIYYNLDN